MKTFHLLLCSAAISLLSACATQNPAPPPYAGQGGEARSAQSSNYSNRRRAESSSAASQGQNTYVARREASSHTASSRERMDSGDATPAVQNQQPAANAGKSAIVGVWSGVSDGERIVLKVGQNGSLSLTNTGGANSGEWSPGGSQGRYSVQFGGRSGEFVLVNARTATLRVMGSTIELHR